MMAMRRFVLTVGLALLMTTVTLHGQQIDLLIKNGHVIDPKNNIDGTMDVAIVEGKILRVARVISEDNAKKIVDAKGMYVTPGFIDMHTHVFVGSNTGFANGTNSISPDDFACRSGVTTVVDAGTSGWRNFPTFKEQVIDRSKTRILAFLSIGGLGLSGKAAQENLNDMNVDSAVYMLRQFPGTIVGIKIGHYEGNEWLPFERALSAAERSKVPLFVECHLPAYSLEEQLERMRPGDIITHSFEKVSERMPVVDEEGTLRPFVKKAMERGVLFDVGHGGAGFWFSQAIPALKQGLAPSSFGTDFHRFSMNAGMKDMMNVMSKYMAMGMGLNDVILRATWAPAQAINREDLGHISAGAPADIAVWSMRKGKFGFVDAGGNRIEGNQKLESELTLRDGKVVWDLNGLTAKQYTGP
ncbi:MAG TPA: amidohydrolase/deacetylase family metallohydrolase [Chryseosolibacter sp.]|nr:amidohydrolase/deacetylase family metallohydrolase [Chryseosolibacter sp.]